MLRLGRLVFRSKDPGQLRPGSQGRPGGGAKPPGRGTPDLRCRGMTARSSLVSLSSVQLAVQAAGLAVAVRRRRHYDIGFLRGSPSHVVRDAVWMGTAYSAPAYLIAAQWWATARLSRQPDDGARRLLGMLGVLYCPGYLFERYVRAHLR